MTILIQSKPHMRSGTSARSRTISMTKLIKATRGSIVLDFEGSIIEFDGEAYLTGYGSPDYVIYSELVTDTETGSRVKWDF